MREALREKIERLVGLVGGSEANQIVLDIKGMVEELSDFADKHDISEEALKELKDMTIAHFMLGLNTAKRYITTRV